MGAGFAQIQTSVVSRTADPQFANRMNDNLERFVTATLQQPDAVNTALLFDVPGRNYRYLRAQGQANPQTGALMMPTTPFRVASISKVFTATVILQLVEEGYFTLDTPLSRLLDNTLLPAGLYAG